MYLLQPMVNYLCKPPRRWCDKCVKRRGEICCEGCFRVTKVKQNEKLTNHHLHIDRLVYSTLLIAHRVGSLDAGSVKHTYACMSTYEKPQLAL